MEKKFRTAIPIEAFEDHVVLRPEEIDEGLSRIARLLSEDEDGNVMRMSELALKEPETYKHVLCLFAASRIVINSQSVVILKEDEI